ncbi:hypothetical protein AJ80_04022 [Polytolypa hystricis UAMH7299]|uniref:Uncharacterized protein n=1 Tax=Polytolypa hystricis (strain UAMH7299) TaxID=1447883 RepID=A0A2B7YEA8_POLH7|nr:hypothetical protein AJ80_04022 [Polytolypa hystricis UAMH7299]
MSQRKQYLNQEDFEKGLEALDAELGKHDMIVAFAPITMLTAGGFLAVNYLKSRSATGDLDYLLDPEWEADEEIKNPLREAINQVAEDLTFNHQWANDDITLFVTSEARKSLFEQAERQAIVLFNGEHIRVLAAPMEWAVERKIRRLYAASRERSDKFDLGDCLAMLKYLRERNNGPLDREHIRTLNLNGFDVVPDDQTMDTIETAYRDSYNEDIF